MKTIFTISILFTALVLSQYTGFADVVDRNFSFNYPDSLHKTMTQTIFQDNAWVNEQLETYTYDTQGNVLEQILQNWTNGSWVNNIKDVYGYDNVNNLNTHFNYVYMQGIWNIYDWDSTKYDENRNVLRFNLYNLGQMVYSASSTYTPITDNIQNVYMDEYSNYGNEIFTKRKAVNEFNSDTMLIHNRTYIMDSTGKWIADRYDNYEYNQHKKIIHELSGPFEIHGDRIDLMIESEFTYSYDANDSLTEYDFFSYQGTVYKIFTKYQYDDASHLYRETRYYQNGSLALAWQVITYYYDEQNRLILRNEKYYTDADLSVEFVNSGSAKILCYPNPFANETTIGYKLDVPNYVSLKVCNTLGEEVKNIDCGYVSSGNHNINFDAHDLVTGTYFYSLRIGNSVYSNILKIIR